MGQRGAHPHRDYQNITDDPFSCDEKSADFQLFATQLLLNMSLGRATPLPAPSSSINWTPGKRIPTQNPPNLTALYKKIPHL
jgi:hypothetical protein